MHRQRRGDVHVRWNQLIGRLRSKKVVAIDRVMNDAFAFRRLNPKIQFRHFSE